MLLWPSIPRNFLSWFPYGPVLLRLSLCFIFLFMPYLSYPSSRRTWMRRKDLLTNIFVLKALGWCFPGISEVGRFIFLRHGPAFFDFLIHLNKLLSFLLQIYIYRFFLGSLFFFDDTQIRTTEERAYKQTVYLLDHNVTLIPVFRPRHIDIYFIFTNKCGSQCSEPNLPTCV